MSTSVDIASELGKALSAVRPTRSDPRIGWAWLLPEYRASSTRAFHGPVSGLTVDDAGMPGLEAAMTALLSDQLVTARWRDEDVWTTVLSLLSKAFLDSNFDLRSAVERLRRPSQVRKFAALANVSWDAPPESLGIVTIARLATNEDAKSLTRLLNLNAEATASLTAYSAEMLDLLGPYVVATATSTRQGRLADEDFERAIEDLIGLTLMFSDRLDQNSIYSIRGATNRPGLRGVTLDRSALGNRLSTNGAGELAARVLTIAAGSSYSSISWHSADPLPLHRLLDSQLRELVADLTEASDIISQRLRVAARWYARAFWSDDEEDAALAVSVSLDSLLTGKDALPGAVSKSRFALLERDVAARESRFARYEEVYRVRSAIAHGGDASRRLAAVGGARSMLADTRWVANQLLNLRQLSTPANDAAFRALWASIQWGTLPWASGSQGLDNEVSHE